MGRIKVSYVLKLLKRDYDRGIVDVSVCDLGKNMDALMLQLIMRDFDGRIVGDIICGLGEL